MDSVDPEPKPVPKPLIWIGDSIEMVRSLPEPVKGDLGVALFQAQIGGKHALSKPLRHIGPGVLEVVPDHTGDTFRAVYSVRLRVGSTCSTHSRKNRKPALQPRNRKFIKQRLNRAIEMHEAREKQNG